MEPVRGKPGGIVVFAVVALALVGVALGLAGCSADTAGSAAASSSTLAGVTTTTLASSPSWTSLQVTHNWTRNERPQLDGNRLVWQAFDGLNWRIESYDLTTGAITQLTDGALDDTDPQLSGNHILWTSHSPPEPPLSEIPRPGDVPTLVLYDFATGAATAVPASEGVEDASLAGNLAAWRGGSGTAADIYLYDVATGQSKRLTNDHEHQGHPQTDGRLVAFTTDPGDGHTQVFVYDASTSSMLRLSSADLSVTASDPQVNAGRAVWMETDGKQWSVFLWDAYTKEARLLSRSEKREASPTLGGETVAWLRWNLPDTRAMPHESPFAVILYDLASGVESQVADGALGDLWLDHDGKVLLYTQFVFGGGSELRVFDAATGQDTFLDPDPEELSVGGPAGEQIGGRGVVIRSNGESGSPDYIAGPSLNGGRVVFSAYQSVNSVYDDSDIILAYRGAAPPSPAVPCPSDRNFADIAASPYRVAIEQLGARGILRGKAVGGELLASPSQPVLRWQFLRMVLEATDVRYAFYTDQAKFSDLIGPSGENLFLRRVVAAGLALGITKGTGSSHFSPYAPITRAEAVTMLVRAAEAQAPGSTATPDSYRGALSGLTGVHAESLRRAEYHELLEGLYGFGPSWDAKAVMTRGEAAQVLWNLMGRAGDLAPSSQSPGRATLPGEMPADFGFTAAYGVGAKNIIDTFEGTFIKDVVDPPNPNPTAELRLTGKELASLYGGLMDLGILDYPSVFSPELEDHSSSMTSLYVSTHSSYRLTIRAAGVEKSIRWEDQSLSASPRANALRA